MRQSFSEPFKAFPNGFLTSISPTVHQHVGEVEIATGSNLYFMVSKQKGLDGALQAFLTFVAF